MAETAGLERPVSIIVLCWNQWTLTEQCLASLVRYTDPRRAELIVVDNGSTDETPERLREFEGIRVVRSEMHPGGSTYHTVGEAVLAEP